MGDNLVWKFNPLGNLSKILGGVYTRVVSPQAEIVPKVGNYIMRPIFFGLERTLKKIIADVCTKTRQPCLACTSEETVSDIEGEKG